jgi:hypothetical protein
MGKSSINDINDNFSSKPCLLIRGYVILRSPLQVGQRGGTGPSPLGFANQEPSTHRDRPDWTCYGFFKMLLPLTYIYVYSVCVCCIYVYYKLYKLYIIYNINKYTI